MICSMICVALVSRLRFEVDALADDHSMRSQLKLLMAGTKFSFREFDCCRSTCKSKERQPLSVIAFVVARPASCARCLWLSGLLFLALLFFVLLDSVHKLLGGGLVGSIAHQLI